MTHHDLVIRSGLVADGRGGTPDVADVAIDDGVITGVGRVEGAGRREIDADGLLVTPGFVDVHTHYDGQATWDRALAPSSWHGVTTVVMGNCGVGFAPVHDRDHDALIELMEGVEDIPGAALHEGLSWEWSSYAEFLDAVQAVPHDIDVAGQVPHGALRLHVMGQRGADREPATPEEIEAMGRLARDAVAAGALGFTTSRTLNHKTSRGEPTPTLTASADELAGIARGMGETGTGVLQVVTDFIDIDAEFAMFRRMMDESGRPLSVSVAQSPVQPDSHHRALDHITRARDDGYMITAQVGTRAIGLLLGLECTLNPFMRNPVYRDLAALPLPDRVATMRDPAVKASVLDAHADGRDRSKLGGGLISLFDRMFVLDDPPDYEPPASASIEARARVAGRDVLEFAYDELLADSGHALLYLPFLNYADGNLDAVGEMLRHPYAVPGLSDGGAHVGTICDGSFPTFLLSYWGRDRETDAFDLGWLVKRHTSDTAALVGLGDRGAIAPGFRADLNIIDHDVLQARRPEMHHDLPGGGKRLLQRADGYRHTFVAGTEIMVDGEPTGAHPGRLVHGRASGADVTNDEARDEINQFMRVVGHEMKTPVATLKGLTEILTTRRDAMAPEQVDAAILGISRQAIRLHEMIDNFLLLARIEGGRLETTIGDVAVSEVLDAVVGAEVPEDDHGSVTVRVDPSCTVRADATHLATLLTALLRNAIRHGGDGVSVSATEASSTVEIEIGDDGAGVSDAVSETLFDRFVKAGRGGGTGLGLTIARGLAGEMHGSVEHDATAPGARFVVRLPAA